MKRGKAPTIAEPDTLDLGATLFIDGAEQHLGTERFVVYAEIIGGTASPLWCRSCLRLCALTAPCGCSRHGRMRGMLGEHVRVDRDAFMGAFQ